MCVEARHPRLVLRRARHRRPAADPLDDLAHVIRRRTAAAADQRQPVGLDEVLVRVGQLRRRQRVVRAVRGQDRQARVRHAGERDPGVPGQVAQVLAHLLRPGRAVQPDQVDAERLQRGERGADLGAAQHRAGGLDRDADDDRQVRAPVGERAPGADHGRPQLQQVLRGLDQHGVGAAVDQTADLVGVRVPQGGVAGVAQRRQLGAGADAAEHPARPVRRGRLVGRLPGQRRAGLRVLVDPVRDAVLVQAGQVRVEGVRPDAVHAGVQVGRVDRLDHVRPGDVQHLVAALVPLEVTVHRQVVRLQHRPHRPVGDDNAFGQDSAEIGTVGHGAPDVGGRD